MVGRLRSARALCPQAPRRCSSRDLSYVKNFYDRTRDLLDQHNPDLLYFDDVLLPLGWGGMNIGAYFYNHNLQTNGGKMQAILNIKMVPPRLAKAV